jgi:hypothetical protein
MRTRLSSHVHALSTEDFLGANFLDAVKRKFNFGEHPFYALEAVMNSIRNGLGMRETEIAREPS